MTRSEAPRLEPRRAADFERELLGRARAWIPSWSLDESAPDFGQALLRIAARYSSEVAERLDIAGDKMALGFLDWLGLRAEAARPARMPVVLRLAETAREPVLAGRPVKMQVDVEGATVTFETETDLQVVPGRLEAVVAADPANDAYFLPPPGLGGLDPLEPLPTAWRLKNFAAPGSVLLQLDPGLGLAAEMIVEIAGGQYRIVKAKDDLVTIDPAVPTGEGFETGTRVSKVASFHPFDEGVRNRQEHILYVGDPDLLNVDAAARIEVGGLPTLPAEVEWQYWGKDEAAEAEDADPRWRALALAEEDDPGALILVKPKGAVEPTAVGTAKGRWIRARLVRSDALVETDKIALRINPREDETRPPPALDDPALRGQLPPLEVIVNTTPSPSSNFYLLGREPRLFDTLYVGSAEAFSKTGATAWIKFDLSDGVFDAMAAFDSWLLGRILAGVDQAGALHLFTIGAGGELVRLAGRQPLQPKDASAGDKGIKLTSSAFRPAIWPEGFDVSVAVAAHDQVWVWTESVFFMGSTGFRPWGSVPGDDPDAPVAGLVAIADGGTNTLVALRNGELYKAVPGGSPDWVALAPAFGANEVPVRIAGLRDEAFGAVAGRLLVTVQDTVTLQCALYSVAASGAATLLLANAAGDVVPFGVERMGGALHVAAVQEGAPRLFWAKEGPSPAVTAALEPTMTIGPTILDGQLEGGQLVVYGLASDGADPVLLSWLPFDADLGGVVLSAVVDAGQGPPNGPVTISPAYAYLPGTSRGEIFAAALGRRMPFLANAGAFRSALAFPLPGPTLVAGDTIVGTVGATLQWARVEAPSPTAGSDAFAGSAFFWLHRWFNRDDSLDGVLTFATSAPGIPTSVGPPAAPLVPANSTITLSALLPLGTWLIVSKVPPGPGGVDRELVQITGLAGLTARVEPQLTSAVTTAVHYWTPTATSGRIFPALALDATNNGWDRALLRSGDLFFPSLDPQRQHAIAVAPNAVDQSKPDWIALETPWISPIAPARFIVDAVASGWTTARSDSATNPALAWEYWNGTGWWRLTIEEDETSNFRNSGAVRFVVPADLKATDWAGKTNHWVRARLIGGDYGQESVKVVTKDLGGGQTEQTINRTSEGIQPPYALDVRVAYSVDQERMPGFVLTRDSGTLRDQSDANRAPGAEVEIFTPLAVTLARLDAPAPAANGAGACVRDCDCAEGDASASPAPPAAAASGQGSASASRAGRRALYAGFSKKLLGEPVNLLALAAREGTYDAIAPLAVDALIGDRFRPIVAADETRGLGETGLIKMAFDVEPIQAELFGRTLFWLRLTPAGGDAGWAPSLAGLYPNAVWARAAETMTRELLGSSEGQPLLTLNVARLPLLRDSLELRVREPLGEEERAALLAGDAGSVRHSIPDLPGDWVLWRQVPDPVDCGAADRVYALDEATGAIRFGDGRHGMIPPVGVDSIVAFAYERTEPAGVGGAIAANFVTPRTALNLVTPVESVETVVAADRSAGGVAPETAGRVLEFAPATLRHRGRAVSARDFEEIVRQRSADVVQARCFAKGGRIRLVVVMRGADPAPSQAQQRELRRMLLEVAPATLAAPGALTLAGPDVRRLRVALVLRVRTLDEAGAVANAAKARLVARFDTEHGGERGEGWTLGSSPREDDIAEALLDIAGLDGIDSILLREVDALGTERPWPASLGARELAMLAPADIAIGFAVAEAMA